MKKYRANVNYTYSGLFEYEIIKETKKRITYVREHKNWRTNKIEKIKLSENKFGDSHSWFNSFEEAKLYLIQKHNEKIKYFENRIKYHNSEINKIMNLTDVCVSPFGLYDYIM